MQNKTRDYASLSFSYFVPYYHTTVLPYYHTTVLPHYHSLAQIVNKSAQLINPDIYINLTFVISVPKELFYSQLLKKESWEP